jgi:hypothetical protein
MTDQKATWQEIAKELAKVSDPAKRRKIQRDLRRALERAGFENYTMAKESARKRPQEDSEED